MQLLVQNLLSVGLHHYLILAVVLFGIGTFGVFMRRNALTTLMSIELILNGGNLTLLAFARSHQDMRGQALALLVIAVAAAEQGIFEYSIIETAVEQFLAKRVPPTVTRPRDNAEMARRVRKSYSLRADIVRDIAVMSATWGVFEYEIIEGAVTQYLPLSSRSV